MRSTPSLNQSRGTDRYHPAPDPQTSTADREVPTARIPQAVERMISDNAQRPKVSTFMRRAERTSLEEVPLHSVAAAFEQTLTEAGRSVSPEVAMECAQATGATPS